LKTIIITSALYLLCAHVNSQSLSPYVLATSGDVAMVTVGSVSWTIGEPISENYFITGNAVTTGFHQPDVGITYVVTQTTQAGILPYPNPASERINANLGDLPPGEYLFTLINMNGEEIAAQKFNNTHDDPIFSFSLQDFSNGLYILRVVSHDNKINTLTKFNLNK